MRGYANTTVRPSVSPETHTGAVGALEGDRGDRRAKQVIGATVVLRDRQVVGVEILQRVVVDHHPQLTRRAPGVIRAVLWPPRSLISPGLLGVSR